MEQKKAYIAPSLTAVQFRAERGYAGTGSTKNIEMFFNQNDVDRDTENFTSHNDWRQDNTAAFWN